MKRCFWSSLVPLTLLVCACSTDEPGDAAGTGDGSDSGASDDHDAANDDDGTSDDDAASDDDTAEDDDGSDDDAASDDDTAEDDDGSDDDAASDDDAVAPDASDEGPSPVEAGAPPESEAGTAPAEGAPAQIGPSEQVVMRLLDEQGLGQAAERWVANVTRTPLSAAQKITPASGVSNFVASEDYSFMFLDRAPGAGFEHPTEFVFAEGDAPLVVESQSWWPELDGVGFVVSDAELIQLFPPAAGELDSPYPGQDPDVIFAAEQRPILAFYPDYENDTVELRLFFYVDEGLSSTTPGYLNVFADVDGDGVWSGDGSERPVNNLRLLDQGEGWQATDPFTLPVDEDNKFTDETWLRLTFDDEPQPLEIDVDSLCEESLDCTDEPFNFDDWRGRDCHSEYESSGCTGSVGPRYSNPDVPALEGEASTYVCQPDGIVIPTVTKALVINLGDEPGNEIMEDTMKKLAALFSLRDGDDAVATMNYPTAERALEAITALMAGVQCLDEVQLAVVGHGAQADGKIFANNEHGGVTPSQLNAAITGSAEHCPNPMSYGDGEGCRDLGYCNLNVYLPSCYSGFFLEGSSSLELPGVNVLTAASSSLVSWLDDGGFTRGSRVMHSFVQGFVDNAADAAPYGNGDGLTESAEAQRFAKANYDQGPGEVYKSDPELWQGADCNCTCSAEACPLTQEDCAPQVLDLEACECVPTDYCPPFGDFELFGEFSVFSDPYGHNPYHEVPLDEGVTLPLTRTDEMFTSPGLPGQDIPALSGTLESDPELGCLFEGSGTGVFAGYPDSECTLENGVLLDEVFSARLSCTPSGFPGQPIVFEFDAMLAGP